MTRVLGPTFSCTMLFLVQHEEEERVEAWLKSLVRNCMPVLIVALEASLWFWTFISIYVLFCAGLDIIL